MGGSFGGYMANWIAGHTDRFRAIVTHASLWDARPVRGHDRRAVLLATRDGDPRETERYGRTRPHRFADEIRTPMLVIHGDKDYRVPDRRGACGCGADLPNARGRRDAAQVPLLPRREPLGAQAAATQGLVRDVLAFLAEHVLGKEWQVPDLLR